MIEIEEDGKMTILVQVSDILMVNNIPLSYPGSIVRKLLIVMGITDDGLQ